MKWGARHLSVRFGDQLALDGVSLEVEPGRVTGVVGGDGAGKTTLLRCLVGALPPAAGEVRGPEHQQIGYMGATSGLYPDLTIEENLEFAAAAYGVPRTEIDRRVADYLERTGLAEARDRLARNLSGGMRQKLGVIRAMVHRPDLLVLDEPTTGVDPVSRTDLWWLIARAASQGTAAVFATAYLDEAERVAWLLALDEGRALAEGTPDEIAGGIPGTICTVQARPSGDASRRSWRREGRWRVWMPEGSDSAILGCDVMRGDLNDAITVSALIRELGAEPRARREDGEP